MWSKLMVSASDFALNLIVAMISTSGLLWLTGAARTADPSISPEEIQKQLDEKAKENADLRERAEQARRKADGLEQEAGATKARLPDAGASSQRRGRAQKDLESSEEETRRLDAELQRLLLLGDERKRVESQTDEARKQSGELKKRLLARSREIGVQRERLAEIQRERIQRPIVPINIAPLFSTDARQPVLVLLSQGTVTPVRPPYYSLTRFNNGTQATLSRRGDAVDRALAQGSDFQKLLGEIDTQKQYVFCIVDSSSFATFRAVREELRRREIPLGWDPSEVTGFAFVSGPTSGAVTPGVTK